MEVILDMPLPTFPAENAQDIHNQIISRVSGAHLLRAYLDQRTRGDASQFLNHERSSDAVIQSHGVVWKVHRDILKPYWPIFEDSNQQTSFDGQGRRVMLKYDDPVALEGLLVWLYSGQPPRTTPLQEFKDWERLLRLWDIARRYRISTLMDEITSIILSSKAPWWGSVRMLSVVISIIFDRFNKKYFPQANLFAKRLLYACRERIEAGELDAILTMMPTPFILSNEILERWCETARIAFRNAVFYAMTKNLLVTPSTVAHELPWELVVLVNIWDFADYTENDALAYRVEKFILHEMNFSNIEETETFAMVMDIVIALPETEANLRLRELVFGTLVEKCHLRLLSDDVWVLLSREQKDFLLLAFDRQRRAAFC